MKKLIFTKGDETRPKFENLRDEVTLKESIFSDIYNNAYSLIKEISTTAENTNDKHNRERNNIIAFIGERGSGKTSCLKSIYHSLNKQQGMALPIPIDGINVSFNNKLPIIDPSYFDEQSNIIEIVIAHMFRTFKNVVDNNKHTFEGDNLTKKRDLVKKFQDVKEALDCTKSRDSKSVSNDSIEQLSKLASGSNLHDSMERLVECYLDYFKPASDKNSQMLVIAIDDLDVQTNHTYQMVEQIRKYLIIDNVIILMGVKLVQLSDLIKKKFVEDFKYNYRRGKDEDDNLGLSDQIDDMVARYLMKLLPLSHRLNLPSFNDMPEIELAIGSYTEGGNGNDSNANNDNDNQEKKSNSADEIINLHETVLALIYRKTGLMFYNFNQESLIVPHNLRELLNLIALLNNMREEDKIKNRNIFRQYFVESWCLDGLTPQHYIFIKELNECNAREINQSILSYLGSNESVDVASIADVNAALTTLSKENKVSSKRFAFAIKTIYSMRLHNQYDQMSKDNNIKFQAKLLYKYLTNGTISYKSINKLSHIFDYEKMIGGNISNILSNKANRLPFAGTLKITNVHSLYTKLDDLLKPDNIQDEYKAPEKVDDILLNDFNAFELLLLSTGYYHLSNKIKTYYYNSFPISQYPHKGSVQFDITTLLYNITRYCNLYHLYKKIKTEYKNDIENMHKLPLVKFFKLVEAFKEKSIIYQLGSNNITLDLSKRSAITNIEVLELLDDYLDRNIDANTCIQDAFKTLVNFKYYLYDTKVITKEDNHDKLLQLKIDYVEHGVNATNKNIIDQTITRINNIFNPDENTFKFIFNKYE